MNLLKLYVFLFCQIRLICRQKAKYTIVVSNFVFIYIAPLYIFKHRLHAVVIIQLQDVKDPLKYTHGKLL